MLELDWYDFFRLIPIIWKFLGRYRYINLLATKLCHYFSTNLTLKASIIPLQRKTIANTRHTPVLFIKKINKKFDLAINSQEQLCLLSKINSSRKLGQADKQFKEIGPSWYFIGGRHWYNVLAWPWYRPIYIDWPINRSSSSLCKWKLYVYKV